MKHTVWLAVSEEACSAVTDEGDLDKAVADLYQPVRVIKLVVDVPDPLFTAVEIKVPVPKDDVQVTVQ